jgi:hypothetical protein
MEKALNPVDGSLICAIASISTWWVGVFAIGSISIAVIVVICTIAASWWWGVVVFAIAAIAVRWWFDVVIFTVATIAACGWLYIIVFAIAAIAACWWLDVLVITVRAISVGGGGGKHQRNSRDGQGGCEEFHVYSRDGISVNAKNYFLCGVDIGYVYIYVCVYQ